MSTLSQLFLDFGFAEVCLFGCGSRGVEGENYSDCPHPSPLPVGEETGAKVSLLLGERLSGRETLGEGEVIQLHLPESTGKQTPQVMAYTKWALALRFKWPTPVRMAMRSPSSRI